MGVSANPEWPSLAGQNAGYLAAQIIAFRDGVRENLVMAPFVATLSDADVAALADYFAAQDPVATASGDPGLVSSGENLAAYCKACHGMQGYPATNEWPALAGQHARYLENQLAMFKSGKRVNGHMQAVVAPLGPAEFAALAAYYSQLAP
jgi:cytochrome c553